MAGRRFTVSDSEILRFFQESEDPFVTTNEVADFLDFSNHGARKRLYSLAEDGLIDYKKVGRSPAWWLTDEGEQFIESSDE